MSRRSTEQVSEILDTPDECLPTSLSCDKITPFSARILEEQYEDERPTVHKDGSFRRITAGFSPSEGSPPKLLASTSHDRALPLGYRRSTRELISKYEDISNPRRRQLPTGHASKHTITHSSTSSLQRRNFPLPELPSSAQSKAHTPFFRNLLTVFAKKNKSPKSAHPQTCTQPEHFPSCSPLRTGPGLYLSYFTRPPTWRSCTLTLYPLHVALTFSEDDRRITHTISLLYCVDVISLVSHQLSREFPKPCLGGDKETGQIAHVFEMTFEGSEVTKERLAAWSVAERGRWVSTIWDALLACRAAQDDIRVPSPDDIACGPFLEVVNCTTQSSSPASSPPVVSQQEADAQNPPESPHRIRAISFSDPLDRPSRPSSPLYGVPPSSFVQTPGTLSIIRPRLVELGAKRASYAGSLSRGASGHPGSYVASSLEYRTKRTDRLQDIPMCASQPSDGLVRSSSAITSRVNCGEDSQEKSFTALDAHAMYHQSDCDSVDPAVVDAPFKHHVEEVSQISGNRNSESVGGLERDIHSWLRYFHNHTVEQSSQTSGLADRLASLDDGVDNIIANLTTLPQNTSSVDLTPIHAKLDEIRNAIAVFDAGTMRNHSEHRGSTVRAQDYFEYGILANRSRFERQMPSKSDVIPVLTKQLQDGLNGHLSVVLQKLEDLQASRTMPVDMSPVLAKLEEMMAVINTWGPPEARVKDSMNIHTNLDDLVALCAILLGGLKDSMGLPAVDSGGDESVLHNVSCSKHSKNISGGKPEGDEVTAGETADTKVVGNSVADADQVSKLLELLQQDRGIQVQQQADSVRYLHELNAWLESFVTSSFGNMQEIATGVNQLRKEWLPTVETPPQAESSSPAASTHEGLHSPGNLFASLQRFLAEQEDKTEQTRNLQSALQALTETLKEDMEKNAEARFQMLRHAQVQESLMNEFATELTKEIRGERLRFVDAMKDATSVNVAIHVEEFKRVLGKLHTEKMVLEQQIAELFSFVSKQKQGLPSRKPLEVSGSRRPLPQINKLIAPPVHNDSSGPS